MKRAVKLILTWDLRAEQSEAFFEFNQRKFVPRLRELGIEPSDAWYTQYGKYPKFMVAAIADDEASIQESLSSAEWQELRQELLQFVQNYSEKIIYAHNGFQQ